MPDGAVGGVTETLERSDQGSSTRADQPSHPDGRGRRGEVNLAAMPTPTGMTAMFLDLDRDHTNLDLLDNANVVAGRTQSVAAVRAKLRDVVVRRSRELRERDQTPFVFGVSGLSADVAVVLSGRRLGFGRLDDVGGGRLGGGRGVLAGS